jgi:hypothetical protein
MGKGLCWRTTPLIIRWPQVRETRLDDKLTYIRMKLSALQSRGAGINEDMQPEIDYLDSATTSFKELILALSDAVVSLKSAEER